MGESAHGDDPGPAAPEPVSEATPDTPPRESVARAIPVVAPHPGRSHSHTPSLSEEADTAGDLGDALHAETAVAESREPQVVPEVIAPSGCGIADARQEVLPAADRAVELAGQPEETHSPPLHSQPPRWPEVNTADQADPAHGPSDPPEDREPPVEREPVSASTAAMVDRVPHEEPQAIESAASPADQPEPPSDAAPANAELEPDGSSPALAGDRHVATPVDDGSEVAIPADAHITTDEKTWGVVSPGRRDTDIRLVEPPPSRGADAQSGALTDQSSATFHEDQIWSGPDVVEPVLSQSGRIESHEVPSASARARARARARAEPEPQPPPDVPSAAFAEASGASDRTSTVIAPAALWPSPSVPEARPLRDVLPFLRAAVRAMGVALIVLAAAVLLLIAAYRWVDPPTSTLMLGQRFTGSEINQRWVPISRISTHLIQAVILSEDGAFCRHHGVDWSALEEAIESSRGGSTITMQVVKNLFLWPARSYVRKALEIGLAYVVEVFWPKQRVLEIYLNIAEWGPGVFGAEAAARTQFGKTASQLTPQEAALLAISLPNPIERQAGDPDAQMRRLASNLLVRMRAVRGVQRCVRAGRSLL